MKSELQPIAAGTVLLGFAASRRKYARVSHFPVYTTSFNAPP